MNEVYQTDRASLGVIPMFTPNGDKQSEYRFISLVCSLLCAALILSSCGGSGIATPTAKSSLILPTHIPTRSQAPQGDQLFLSDFTIGIIERVDLSPSSFLATSIIITGLSKPEDGACNANGQVFFAVPTEQKIIRFNTDGSDLITVLDPSLPTPEGQEFYPEGLSFDNSGNLFFNTSGMPFMPHPHSGVYRIVGADPQNKPERVIPSITKHGEGTAFLPTGELLATDWTGGRIIKSVPPQFGFGDVFASNIPSPHGIAITSDGDVYVSEGGEIKSGATSRIFHFDSKGNLLGVLATLNEVARHIELDSLNNLYVGTITGGVFRITPEGAISPIARGRHVSGLALCKAGHGR